MNRPEFPRATNVVTLRCNLNCKLCVIGAPYYRSPWHPTLEYVNSVTDRLFEIANFNIFDLTGGEPMLRKDLPQILEHMLPYKNQVSGRFGFQSNGSIKVSDELVYAIRHFGSKFKLVMDNYGPSLSRYAEENYDILKSANIPVELRCQHAGNEYCDGWVDYIENGSIRHSEKRAKELFLKCAQPQIMGFCATVIEGRVLPCPVMYSLSKICGLDSLKSEYIDIFDQAESIEAKREKWKNIYDLDMLQACKFCNGLCGDSKRFIPALQLTIEEQKQIKKV